MAKIDEIKEDIGWLKVMFGIVTAIDISLLGWLTQNYKTAELIISILAFIIILLATIGIIIINKIAYKKIKEIGEL